MISQFRFSVVVAVLAAGSFVAILPTSGAETTACAADPALPVEISGWAKPSIPFATAHDPAEAASRVLPLGQKVAFKLANSDTIRFVHAPSEQMPKQYVYSGMASFHVPKDGNYSVMIGEANWIDVIQNGQAIKSLEMRGRVPCIKYGKKIEFPLRAGEAVVQFFGAPYETVDVLIAPAP